MARTGSDQIIQRKSVSRKFFEMMRGNMMSRVSGFLREVVVASFFGASRATDVFAIAFTIPTLFRRILGEDMVEKAFLPSFRQLVAAGEHEKAWRLASKMFSLMVLTLLMIMGILYLVTPDLVRLIGAGLEEKAFKEAVIMTYILLPFMVLIGMAAFVGGLLLFMDATDVYGFAPVMLSVGVIAGVVLLSRKIGIYALAVGFLLGGLLQLLYQLPYLYKRSREYRGKLRFNLVGGDKIPEISIVGKQSGWIFLQSISSKTVEIVDRLLASYLVAGSVAALYFAQRLIQLPNAILSLALSRAYVTDLNDYAQKRDWISFKRTIVDGLKASFTLMIPVTALLVGLSEPITVLVFKRGVFGAKSVAITSVAFTYYSLGLVGMAVYNNYTRIFPALNKNQWPVLTSIVAAIVNVVLNIMLVRTPLAHGGIALASSLAFTLNACLLFVLLNRELKILGAATIGFDDVKDVLLPVSLGALVSGMVVHECYRGWLKVSDGFAVNWQMVFDWQAVLGIGIAGIAGAAIFILVIGYWGRFRKKRGKRVLLTGGGTGGHVNPALAIAEAIKEKEQDVDFLYVGVRGKAESVIVTRTGYPIKYIDAVAFPGFRPSPALVKFLATLGLGMIKSFWILTNYQPEWIIGTGGYVCAPIIFTHTIMKYLGMSKAKVFIHEQNSVPGKLNALVGRFADKVFLTFPQTVEHFPRNGVVVGYPVRRSVKVVAKEEALASLDFKIPEGSKVVFVFGGSQGARTINRAIVDALREFINWDGKIFIIHGMGILRSGEYDAVEDTEKRLKERYSEEELKEINKFYYRKDYFHNIGDIYAVSDLIVCRSGAGSLNEISMVGKPALIIPKANLPGDHQVMNARAMKRAGAAEIIFEDTVIEDGVILEKVEGSFLAKKIKELVSDEDRLRVLAENSRKFMRRRALERIVNEIYGRESCDDGVENNDRLLNPLLSNSQLLSRLSAAYNKASANSYHPLDVIKDVDDLQYYRHRAAALLTHQDWWWRNIGVKLVGLLKYQDKIPTLLYMLTDRTPVSPIKRFLGGDFNEVGFIRRNVLTSLRIIDYWDEEIEEVVLQAFNDPYYEVVANAARTGEYFANRLKWPLRWQKVLIEKLNDRHLEIVTSCASALGAIGVDEEAMQSLIRLSSRLEWQIRDASLRAIRKLLKRGIVRADEKLFFSLSKFILTSTDFRPFFSIKESYRMVTKEIEMLIEKRKRAESEEQGKSN